MRFTKITIKGMPVIEPGTPTKQGWYIYDDGAKFPAYYDANTKAVIVFYPSGLEIALEGSQAPWYTPLTQSVTITVEANPTNPDF